MIMYFTKFTSLLYQFNFTKFNYYNFHLLSRTLIGRF